MYDGVTQTTDRIQHIFIYTFLPLYYNIFYIAFDFVAYALTAQYMAQYIVFPMWKKVAELRKTNHNLAQPMAISNTVRLTVPESSAICLVTKMVRVFVEMVNTLTQSQLHYFHMGTICLHHFRISHSTCNLVQSCKLYSFEYFNDQYHQSMKIAWKIVAKKRVFSIKTKSK